MPRPVRAASQRAMWGCWALVRVLRLYMSEGQLVGRPDGVRTKVTCDQRLDLGATEILWGLRGKQDKMVGTSSVAC